MRNEKGATLIELMAALLVSSVIFGAAAALYTSVHHLWKQDSQKFADDSANRYTVNTINKQLTETSAAAAFENELRMKLGPGDAPVVSLVHDPATGELALYQFGDSSKFADGSVSLTADPALYTARRLLSDDVLSLSFYSRETDGTLIPLTGRTVSGGTLIHYNISFATGFVTAGGGRETRAKSFSGTAKLIQDYTAK